MGSVMYLMLILVIITCCFLIIFGAIEKLGCLVVVMTVRSFGKRG